MCTGASSSTLLTENKILKIENLNQKEFNAKPDLIKELKEWIATSPKYLTFHGGETMMMPEVKELISWGIKNNLLDNTEIRMITNATKFDSEWADLFSKLKNLTLMVSIDGFDKVNDYIRFGSRWDSVQSAVVEMKKLPNTKLLIHSTLQNLNILTFDKLISWAEEQEIFFNFDMIRPGDFDLNTFPPELLLLAKERLEKHKNFKNAFVSYDSLIKMVDTAIATSTYNTEKWAKFVDIINLRDQHRRTSILNVIPELANYWPDNINTPATLAEENE
jgi:MoaA/NifB/PqqE/SkfB family radical SAM enzyme